MAPAEGMVHLETTKCCVSVNPSGEGTSVLDRRHSSELMLTETDMLGCPPTPCRTEVTFLGSMRFSRAGAHKPISGHSSRPCSSVSRTPVVSTRGPAPRKAGTIYRDFPLAEHMCKEDVEQGMTKGRVRGAKGTATFISTGMGDVKGRI